MAAVGRGSAAARLARRQGYRAGKHAGDLSREGERQAAWERKHLHEPGLVRYAHAWQTGYREGVAAAVDAGGGVL